MRKYVFKKTWLGAWPTGPLGWFVLILADVVALSFILTVMLSYEYGGYEFIILAPLLSFWYSSLLWFVYKNEKKHEWFTAKRKGFGWHPISWQGWLVVAIILSLLSVLISIVSVESLSGMRALKSVLPALFLLVISSMWVCHTTSTPPQWRFKK